MNYNPAPDLANRRRMHLKRDALGAITAVSREVGFFYPLALLSVLLPLLAASASAQVAGTLAGIISGRLLSAEGVPVAGIRISAITTVVPDVSRPAGSAIVSFAETDHAGRYRLESVPPGRYIV